MSLLAQTITGKFDTADILFAIAFFIGAIAVVIDIVAPEHGRVSQILIRACLTLIACAFWIS